MEFPLTQPPQFAFQVFSTPDSHGGKSRERHIAIARDGNTAWFDEILWNDNYGTCRGTGVLIRTDHGWRIAQYNLSIPIPNDVARELTTRIKDFENHSPN